MFVETIALIFLVYFAVGVLYLLFFSIVSLLPAKYKHNPLPPSTRFAVLIPAYNENNVIKSVSKAAVSHNYPKHLFDVFVIADTLDKSTIDAIKSNGCYVIEVKFDNSTKAKSLNAALEILPEDKYDAAVVLDVDNIMKPDFLKIMNDAMQEGFQVVQGHRTAKNMNTTTAVLDAATEEIHNAIYRKAHRLVGLSASGIGSAFAINLKLFKRIMFDIRDVAGEDRELDLKILAEKIKVEYREDAFVLDEKVDNWEVFSRQRSRWAAAHADYIVKFFLPSIYQLLIHFNINYFNKVWQAFIPQRILLTFLLILIATASYLIELPYATFWILLCSLNIFAMFIALPRKFYNKQFLFAAFHLPKMVFATLLAWTKIKGQKNKFLHTPHKYDGEDK